jgi:trimethylamine-N-oxide reductase cytochrome c-type subunit TorC
MIGRLWNLFWATLGLGVSLVIGAAGGAETTDLAALAARAREEAAAFMSRTEPLDGQSLLTKRTTSMLAEPDKGADKVANVLPGAPAEKLERKGDFVKVRIDGWQAGTARRGQYAAFGKRILNMSIAAGAVDSVSLGEKRFYQEANQDWTRSSLVGWLPAADLTQDPEMLWRIAEASYSSQCGVCHAAKPPASRDSLSWQTDMKAYQPRTGLTEEEGRLVLRFLQTRAADAPKG